MIGTAQKPRCFDAKGGGGKPPIPYMNQKSVWVYKLVTRGSGIMYSSQGSGHGRKSPSLCSWATFLVMTRTVLILLVRYGYCLIII